MLYSSFRTALVIAAIMGIIDMLVYENYKYIFFPLAIIIWAIYVAFDKNDREYLRRNGYDPDEVSWFFPEYSYYDDLCNNNSSHQRTYPARKDNSIYAPKTTYYNNYISSQYNGMKNKCKRNFKITVEANENNE